MGREIRKVPANWEHPGESSMSDGPGWRKYECPICKGQRIDCEPKENQPPCKLCGHGLTCIDENYGRFMTAPCNLGIGGYVLAPLSNEPNPYVGRMVVHDIN